MRSTPLLAAVAHLWRWAANHVTTMSKFKSVVYSLALAGLTSFTVQGADQQAFKDRMENTAEINEAGKEWFDALVGVSGETNVQPVQVLVLLAQVDAIWDPSNRLRRDVSKQYVARIGTFNRTSLHAWQNAMDNVSGRMAGPTLLTLLVQHESLFEKAALRAERATKLQARLKSLPATIVAEWSEASGLPCDRAALNLIGLEGVFSNERLDERAFGKVINEAKAKRTGK